MRLKTAISGLLLLNVIVCTGQTEPQNVTGQVSFVSSKNVYVRFSSTRGISVNDTLYKPSGNDLIPVLVVNSLSSSSCLCTAISTEELPIGHIIISHIKPTESGQTTEKEAEAGKEAAAVAVAEKEMQTTEEASAEQTKEKAKSRQRISGSISAASYSQFSGTPADDIQRFRYTLSLNASNIGDTRLSARTYISFRHKLGAWDEVKEDIFSALKIYSLELRYDFDSTAHVGLGRQINPRISSIGSFDGLEVEKSFKGFTVGAIGGFRPDYHDYGFNPDLLQFGTYLAYDISTAGAFSGTSLAFMNQMNAGKTDRRFLYFQQSCSFLRRINIFGSFETDLFRLVDDAPVTDISLTSLYASVSFRVTDGINVGGSYDARKNPVYYETFRITADTLFEKEMRQAWRVNASFRIARLFTLGVQSSLRFLNDDNERAKNLSGYLTFRYPGKNYLSATLSASYAESSFITGLYPGINATYGLLSGKIQVGAGYYLYDYKLAETMEKVIQHTLRSDLYWQVTSKISLSLNYDIAFEGQDIYNRLYAQVRLRF